MTKQTSVSKILKKTADNWPESNQDLSPEILRIHRISTYLHLNLEQVLDAHMLQAADFSVLETLRKELSPHCLTPTELSTAMLFSSGGLTKVLNRITTAGFIVRVNNTKDKRGKLVQLTQTGKALIDNVIVELHAKEQNKMNILSANEKDQLNILLEKILHVWE